MKDGTHEGENSLTFLLNREDKISIIGCGGKTSLMFLLAESCRPQRVLVTTTTKIFMPEPHQYDYFYHSSSSLNVPPGTGIHLLGAPHDPSGKKLVGVEENDLAGIKDNFDLVLMEADGSRGLPLKGWEDFEPVVPEWTTMTLGIAPLWTVGKEVSENIVMRLPLFCSLTGAVSGEEVTLQHIARMIGSPGGMFEKARGRRVLFFNQVEDEVSMEQARLLASYPELSGLDMIIAGSVVQNRGTVLFQGGM